MSNAPIRVVADASVVINLIASQCAMRILKALPMRIVVVDVVARELNSGADKGRKDARMLDLLVSSGMIELVSLGDVGDALFERLTAGPAAATLDDGEAATIAFAVERSLGVILDDQKARRICGDMFPGVARRCSCEMFRDPSVSAGLGNDQLVASLLNALRDARMRVLPEHVAWVIKLIGREEALKCHSLPRSRVLLST